MHKSRCTLPVIVLVRFVKRARYIKPILFLIFFLWNATVYCQTLPVSDRVLNDYVRILQLSGKANPNLSLMARPLSISNLKDSSTDFSLVGRTKELIPRSDFFSLKILPVHSIQQFNSSRPYGWNDGLVIPAAGFQQYLSGGFFVKIGPLSVQLKPEYVFAANPEFLDGNDQIASSRYISYISTGTSYGADLPTYYEGTNFQAFGIGQSSVRLTVGPASLGISNENLWWGPGRNNSLLMSNTARGFKHLTLNTSRPIVTPVGNFEGQIISAKLQNSRSPLNAAKSQDWRYLSGMVLNYQPKWIKGLSLGLTRVFQIYNSDIDGIGDYLPLFQPFEKKNTLEDSKRRDQLSSVFARFIFKEAQAEVYAEFARNDHSFNIRDFIQEPQHSRAYIFGFQKLIPLDIGEQSILFSAEVSQLSQPLNKVLRDAGTWYTHEINQGYTNYGEVIGAGTGPGGNIQTLELSWLKGFKKLGFQIDRYEHNRDYYQLKIDANDDYNENWVDVSMGIVANWDYRNLLIHGRFAGVQSLNYLWQTGIDDLPQRNQFNLHANVGVSYYFK